jgi:hypothetical protein
MSWYRFVLGALAVWRITHLLNAEDGPGDVFVRFRKRAGNGWFGSLLDCFYCLSMWVAAPLAWIAGTGCVERLLLWPALSGAAILLERTTARPEAWTEVPYFEEEKRGEPKDGMLQ